MLQSTVKSVVAESDTLFMRLPINCPHYQRSDDGKPNEDVPSMWCLQAPLSVQPFDEGSTVPQVLRLHTCQTPVCTRHRDEFWSKQDTHPHGRTTPLRAQSQAHMAVRHHPGRVREDASPTTVALCDLQRAEVEAVCGSRSPDRQGTRPVVSAVQPSTRAVPRRRGTVAKCSCLCPQP